jgi:hypothetical protein
LSLLALAACSGGPSSPSATQPSLPSETFQLVNTEADLVGAQSDQTGTVGDFRLKPGPDSNGVIRLTVGDSLTLNGNSYRPQGPETTVYLVANWGDGNGNERIGCGPCRLTHVYTTPGRFSLQMTIDDGIVRQAQALSPISEVVTVIAEGIPVEPEPSPEPEIVGNRPSANWTTITVACTPLDTTVNMRVTDLDGDSSQWSVSLTGGTLTSPASGGPVASGGTVTIRFTGVRGLSTLRLDLVDGTGLASVPVTRYGPAATCGGQTLHILG